jgi:hypothetical protein
MRVAHKVRLIQDISGFIELLVQNYVRVGGKGTEARERVKGLRGKENVFDKLQNT